MFSDNAIRQFALRGFLSHYLTEDYLLLRPPVRYHLPKSLSSKRRMHMIKNMKYTKRQVEHDDG